VDLDAHPGDGTYSLAKHDEDIAIFDIAYGTWDPAEHNDRTAFFDVGDVQAYRAALQTLPAFLDRVKPRLVQYQAGVDCYEHDPVGGIDGVDAEFLRWRDTYVIGHIMQRQIPLVVVLAGGYVDGLSERLHVETIRVAAEALRRHRAGEMCSFDTETGILNDNTLHADLLGDDECEWDLDLSVCGGMTDEQMEKYFDEHAKKHYGSDRDPER